MSRGRGYRFLDPAALARVRNLSLAARGVVEGFVAGLHSSPYKGFSVEFAEHRKYCPGDNLRYLDWRVLGRTNRLYLKQFEEETNLRAYLLLDVSGSMGYRLGAFQGRSHLPSGTPLSQAPSGSWDLLGDRGGEKTGVTKLEYASYLSAVLAYLMMRQQDAVGLTAFDTQLRLDMPARSSPRHFDEMMRQVEALRPGKKTGVAASLNRLAERFKRRCLIILLSDLFDDLNGIERALHHFRHRKHEMIVFHILDKAELEFPYRDTATFIDLETGERLQVDPAYVREEYRRQIAQLIDRCKQMCANCQVDYVMTDTSVPYDFMLSRYLVKRARL
jgi:uncharacterized protein (DUF58 family)